MSRPLTPLPQHLAAGPFTAAAALEAGVSPRRLRHPSIAAPFSGLRRPGEPSDDVVDLALTLAPALDRRHAFGGPTALALLTVDQPPRLLGSTTIYLAVADQGARVRRPGVVTWVAPAYGQVANRYGLRVTAPATTFLHLARLLTLEELVMVGDALTRRCDPLVTVADLVEHVAGAPRCIGIAAARAALEHIRPGTDSVPETILRRIIQNAGLPCPEVNRPARLADGTYLGRPDLSYPDLRISVEYLGDVHRTDRRTWRTDVARNQRFRDHGWTVLEATADTLTTPAPLLTRLRDLLP